jgi:hypothetical protein
MKGRDNMLEGIALELEKEMHEIINDREKKITGHLKRIRTFLEVENHPRVYGEIAEISRHTELMVRDLRETMTGFYNMLQISGIQPMKQLYPGLPNIDISEDNGCVAIKLDAMMPYPIKGRVYYLHDKLDMALERFYEERKPPRPYFTERCAVVFLHHYGSASEDLRHLRDYDNVERRCITNVLAAHLLWGDSPKCMIGMDVLAPGERNYTEIRVMPLPQFRDFATSKDIEFTPENNAK